MTAEKLLSDGIRSIKDAYTREHTARKNLAKMLENAEAENAKLRELIVDVHEALCADKAGLFHKLTLASMEDDMRELGIEVD